MSPDWIILAQPHANVVQPGPRILREDVDHAVRQMRPQQDCFICFGCGVDLPKHKDRDSVRHGVLYE